MSIQLSSRKMMLVVLLLSPCLVAGKRIWFNEWAPVYHKRYQDACRWIQALRQKEASYRAAGQIENVRDVQRLLQIVDQERRDSFWKWVKAILLDEA